MVVYMATGSWFSLVENMQWAKEELRRDFVMAELYLACSDLTLTYEQITAIYKKTMGRRRISQIGKKQCRLCKITNKNNQDTNQSFYPIPNCRSKIRMAKTTNRAKPFCHEGKNLSGCAKGSLF